MSNSELMETIITRELLLSQASARKRSVDTQLLHRDVMIFCIAKVIAKSYSKDLLDKRPNIIVNLSQYRCQN